MFQTKPAINLISQIELKPEKQDNPFEKAILENERIENKQELERKKLSDFKLRVKQRLTLYKHVENKIDKDFKINFNISKTPLKIKLSTQIDTEAKEKTIEKKPIIDHVRNEGSIYLNSVSTSDLPDFVIRSLVDEYESKKQLDEERMKRISSMRKIYSNIERDKIKKFNSVKDWSQDKINNSDKLNSNPKNNNSTNLVRFNDADIKKVEFRKFNGNPMKPLSKRSKNSKIQSEVNSENDIERYIRNLKVVLREKSKQTHLPTLCQCNTNQVSLWDNDWSQCANNCNFYKNPKEYAKVLLNLINEKNKIENN